MQGLCAAFIAQEKGHQVTLYEASDKLGGNMRLAALSSGKRRHHKHDPQQLYRTLPESKRNNQNESGSNSGSYQENQTA